MLIRNMESFTWKCSWSAAPDQLTTQDIINASSSMQGTTQCREQHNLWYPTVEQFLNLFTEIFNQGVFRSVLVSAKSAVTHVLRIQYQHIRQHPSVIEYFKVIFNLRPPLLKLFVVWDVQVMFEYFKCLREDYQVSEKQLSQILPMLLLLLVGKRLKPVFYFTIDRMTISSTSVTFSPEHDLKYLQPCKYPLNSSSPCYFFVNLYVPLIVIWRKVSKNPENFQQNIWFLQTVGEAQQLVQKCSQKNNLAVIAMPSAFCLSTVLSKILLHSKTIKNTKNLSVLRKTTFAVYLIF